MDYGKLLTLTLLYFALEPTICLLAVALTRSVCQEKQMPGRKFLELGQLLIVLVLFLLR